jgi:hypothetical protein
MSERALARLTLVAVGVLLAASIGAWVQRVLGGG